MKNGLKGVTDATVFCKSMKKGGPASMIQPMKKYATGGMTDECAGKPKKPGCFKKFSSKGKSSGTKGGWVSGLTAAAAAALAALGLDKMNNKE